MNRYVRWILLLPNLWLIYHIFITGYDAIGTNPMTGQAFYYLAKLGLLTEFKMYRNALYIVYVVLLLTNVLSRKFSTTKPEKRKGSSYIVSQNYSVMPMNDIVAAMLTTTFAYAIAAILLDVVNGLK